MTASLRIGEVVAGDQATLATFACARYDEPWAEVVEVAIRQQLVDELDAGRSQAIGLWEGEALVAVAAYRVIDSPMFSKTCRVNLLAVRTDRQGRGCARRLKEAIVDLARAEGALAVSSRVHRRNTRMLQVNLALGARLDPIEHSDDEVICTIPIRESS